MRTRQIKPEFFKNEYLAECSPHARLLYIHLWQRADREGRLEDRAKRIAPDAFPYEREVDVEALLVELATNEDKDGPFIRRYTVGGKNYIWIPKFRANQKFHPGETRSEIPPHPKEASIPDGAGEDHVGDPKQVVSSPCDLVACDPELDPPLAPKGAEGDFSLPRGEGDRAAHLVEEFREHLLSLGRDYFPRAWRRRNLKAAQRLLSHKPYSEVVCCFHWATSEAKAAAAINNLDQVEALFNTWKGLSARESSKMTYPERVRAAQRVAVTTERDQFTCPGSDLRYNDAAREYTYVGSQHLEHVGQSFSACYVRIAEDMAVAG